MTFLFSPKLGITRSFDVLTSSCLNHGGGEIRVAHCLQRVDERRRVARSQTIGAVACEAIGTILDEADVRVPVDRAILSNIVSGHTGGIHGFAVRIANGLGIARRIGDSDHARQKQNAGD